MNIYTIGFTKKSAREFFELLLDNDIKKIIDIRLRNNSQLAGFAKAKDLKYFLEEIDDIAYIHKPEFAPSKELLNSWRNDEITWKEYEKIYLNDLKNKVDFNKLEIDIFDNSCLLCSENLPEKCHRRLLAEFIDKKSPEKVQIHHLKV